MQRLRRAVLWIVGVPMLVAASCNGASTTPPATPTGLAAQAGDGFVTLSWDANTEPDLLRYNIYRGDAGGVAVRIDDVPSGTEEYEDTDVVDGVTYAYAIDAENAAGARSGRTEEVSVTPGPDVSLGVWDVSNWDEATWGP